MLNLTFQIAYQYTSSEKRHLRKLRAKYGRQYQLKFGKSQKRVWYDGENKSISIKHNIVTTLLKATRFRCAYCSKRLTRSEKPVDHFLPNSDYPALSFHPLNLIPACGYCNSSLKKAFDPLVASTGRYKYHKSTYFIVHPIIHDVGLHVQYSDPERTILDLPNCSIEGLNSIDLFELNTFEMNDERRNQFIINRDNPLSNADLIRLVHECATYQPK